MTLPRSSSGVPYWPGESGPDAEPPSGSRRGLLVRVVLFVLLFAVMLGAYDAGRGGWVERLVIDRATVGTAAWLIDAADPALGVEAAGSRLRAPGGGINVLNGCEGADVMFLMASAMLVAPLSWRRRLAGLAVGAAMVFALNQVRIIALFYSFRSDPGLFEMLHGLIAPLLLVAAVAAFFFVWLERAPAAAPAAQCR
ncbi:archaeosortase/exosortase family protein [Thauera sinica]|uniref:Archaeosortase/exosortase family protein n=1 Tax=Thauera sinica TaxID=2665146 RepID=A0ABW1AUE0_9RHOO|nr:archaeosortase/exosortase family protein [Thauera sp. K11]ATE60026.1 exosortase/archaeosortase family protein [Thauera sp. K11]